MTSVSDPFQPRNRSHPEDRATIPRTSRRPHRTTDITAVIRAAAERDLWLSWDPRIIRLAADTLTALDERDD